MRLRTDFEAIKQGRVEFRSSERTTIWQADNDAGDGEELVCTFEGDVRVLITKPFLRFLTKGDLYWIDRTVDQTFNRTSDVVYTSLDRPAPLSPEMLAIERMMRRNAIEREGIRSELEELKNERTANALHATRGRHKADTSEGPAPESDTKRVPAPVSEEPAEPKGEGTGELPDADLADTRGTPVL